MRTIEAAMNKAKGLPVADRRETKGNNNVYKVKCSQCNTTFYTNTKPLELECAECGSRKVKYTWMTHRDIDTLLKKRGKRGEQSGLH